MHPALSIIVFTTMSGLGYGLAAVLGLGALDPQPVAARLAWLVALALIGGGLLASTGHLLNRQRAWRALSQWRSSWLSREGVMAIAGFVPLAVFAYSAVVQGLYLGIWGVAVALFAAATVYCTAMIYASLRSVEAWHTRLTPAAYLAFAAAGGLVLATMFALAAGQPARLLALVAALALAVAWAVKLAWRNRMQTTRPRSTPETATGLGALGRVRLLERPHTNENYLTREMGFQIARKHAAKLFRMAFVAGGAVPLVLMLVLAIGGLAGGIAVAVAALATASHVLGMLVERWLFFAEARHAVMNYY